MKKAMLVLAVLALAAMGCTTVSGLVNKAVDRYCAVPAGEREAVRTLLNKDIAPREFKIDCADGVKAE